MKSKVRGRHKRGRGNYISGACYRKGRRKRRMIKAFRQLTTRKRRSERKRNNMRKSRKKGQEGESGGAGWNKGERIREFVVVVFAISGEGRW